jgi:hypothetical protein
MESVEGSNGHPISRWEQFMSGEPNTMGDTLAGFIGSLTLIWVVASVVQQSMELRAQRREFSEMVAAQEAQVRALENQAAIFEDERKRKQQDQYLLNFVERVKLTRYYLESSKLVWHGPPDLHGHTPRILLDADPNITIGGISDEQFFIRFLGQLQRHQSHILEGCAKGDFPNRPSKSHIYSAIAELEEAESLLPLISENWRLHYRRYRLDWLHSSLDTYTRLDIWNGKLEMTY